ncbi:MAG: class I SAM-dependent methyltransferase [Candidatus Eremiobacteraeota bacterium]|nr:class I SAM-dependent methyltransferase [Candidatus Eremiobacteraeota bacterium]
MKLAKSKEYWDRMGSADSMWAILSAREKLGGQWQTDEFFATGRAEVDATMRTLEGLGVRVDRSRALDFGCGIGRLTQALAEHFDSVVGVDIASTMIAQAESHNAFGERCTYRVNDTDDLAQFPDGSFSFVFSHIVLQHIKAPHSSNYLREFARVAAPGALIVFQLPARNPNARRSVLAAVRKLINVSPVLVRLYRRLFFKNVTRSTLDALPPALVVMEGIDRKTVSELLAAQGVRILHTERDGTQEFAALTSWFYVAQKDA